MDNFSSLKKCYPPDIFMAYREIIMVHTGLAMDFQTRINIGEYG